MNNYTICLVNKINNEITGKTVFFKNYKICFFFFFIEHYAFLNNALAYEEFFKLAPLQEKVGWPVEHKSNKAVAKFCKVCMFHVTVDRYYTNYYLSCPFDKVYFSVMLAFLCPLHRAVVGMFLSDTNLKWAKYIH